MLSSNLNGFVQYLICYGGESQREVADIRKALSRQVYCLVLEETGGCWSTHLRLGGGLVMEGFGSEEREFLIGSRGPCQQGQYKVKVLNVLKSSYWMICHRQNHRCQILKEVAV